MSSTWGNNIKLSLFGESHGNAIGIVIDGLPSGLPINEDLINRDMARRAPGKKDIATPRSEKDRYEILSGLFNGNTTGTPLCCMIKNTDTRSGDYQKTSYAVRPGHADFTGHIKYKGFNDFRGGGHFSGRLTAPLVFAGSIAKQILKIKNIDITSHILNISGVLDKSFNSCQLNQQLINELLEKEICVIDELSGEAMKNAVIEARSHGDSLGGIIETAILNLPAGVGAPFFDSVESRMAHMIFSIPGVKGIEFGAGFEFAVMKGSEANDPFILRNGQIETETNNNGGILGGITNGMPVLFNTVFKPTPSISIPQRTVDIENMAETQIEITGRHDPCIVFRAVPVVESAAALVVLDLLLEVSDIL